MFIYGKCIIDILISIRQLFPISYLEKGEMIPYGACGMPYYVAGTVNDITDLMKAPVGAMRNPGFFKNVRRHCFLAL